ncbi:MAG: hypothetical protein JRI36_09005 [Deltaproteobacteria bacterium]|nr:hypothetical protein [Deltaproteobacteria bacterium]
MRQLQNNMPPDPCPAEQHDSLDGPCTQCLSFYKGLVNALILSGIAWALIFLVVYYALG